MASEVIYAEVSPKERVNFITEASDTGDPITYALVNMKGRSDRPDSTPEITHSVASLSLVPLAVTCWEKSPWCYIVLAVLFCAVVLLLMVILLAVKCYSH